MARRHPNNQRWRRQARVAGLWLAVAVAGASCGKTGASETASSQKSPQAPTTSGGSSRSAPLTAPATTPAQDGQYLEDLAEADPALAGYVQTQGNVALRALLTDGTAFCSFLQRGGGINNAMTSLVIGARSVESQTHLPSTVTTFNTIDAVALLTLCPSEQNLVPTSDLSKIDALGKALAG